MAQYGYSTGYQGGGPNPVPSGYIEAYSNAGRAIGQGISNIGQDIGSTIREYAKNKAEDQYATSKIESMLAQYAQNVQGPGTADGTPASMDHLAGIIGSKNLEAFVSGKANRMQKLAIANSLETYGAQQHQRLQNDLISAQLDQVREAQRKEKAMLDAQKAALGIPTTTSTTEDVYGLKYPEPVTVTETPPAPQASATETGLWKGFLAKAGTAAKQLAADAAAQMEVAKQINVSPQQIEKFVPRSTPAYGFNAPLGSVVPVETPQQAAIRAEQNSRAKAAAIAQAEQTKAKADELAAIASQSIGQQVAQAPVTKTVPAQGPPEKNLVGQKTTVEQAPWEDVRSRITKNFVDRGIPVTADLVNETARMLGYQPPIQVQTANVPGVGTAVKMDGKEHFVPVNQEMARHIEAASINVPNEVTAQFRTISDREKFSEDLTTYKEINKSVKNLTSIIDKYPGVTGQFVRTLSPTVSSEIQNNLTSIRSHLNKQITGGGNLSETDYKRIDAVIADPSKFFTMDSATRTKLLGLAGTAKSNLENKFKSTAISGKLNLGEPEAYNQPGAGVKQMTWNPATQKLE